MPINLAIVNWTFQISVAKQAEAKERVCNPFRKEYLSDACRYLWERVSYTANNNVFEDCRFLDEWRLFLLREAIPLLDKLIWQLED